MTADELAVALLELSQAVTEMTQASTSPGERSILRAVEARIDFAVSLLAPLSLTAKEFVYGPTGGVQS